MSGNDNDDVGYGKPPKHGQFKPGQSGNPRGRPRNAKGLKTLLKAELEQKVAITENGRTTKVSKLDVVVKRMVERAAKGEPRAIGMMVDLVRELFGFDGEASRPMNISSEDQEIMDALAKRLRDENAPNYNIDREKDND